MPSAAENLEEEAVQSEAMVTGYEVLGRSDCIDSAWNFRASERRAELVRAMPSAAENLEEVAVRHRTCPKHPPFLALVTICATDPVAIYPLQLFVSIRAIRGQKKNSQ